jgi:ADP-ribose pyrophosphatase YjhB (NUDIX family)
MVDACVSIAIIEDETILLTLREDFEVWCMPGGELDAGESVADAARREVREEIGLEIELTRLVGVYSRVVWRPHHDFLFTARIVGGALNPDPREVVEARFFPLSALPEHMITGQREHLADVLSGQTGNVVTEQVHEMPGLSLSRAELYAQRDQSGLSRREFYLRNIPLLKPERIQVEIVGAPAQTRSSSSQK